MLRECLIELCTRAVVHHTRWTDRDSYVAQLSIRDIHRGLLAGYEYRVSEDDDKTLWIEFDQASVEKIGPRAVDFSPALSISTLQEYREDCDPDYETEMFDGIGIDFTSNYLRAYMPTPKRLEEVGDGNDWY